MNRRQGEILEYLSEENRAQLTPPMLNKPIWRDSDFVVMILAGPIVRADYHDDPYEEFFFQLKTLVE